MAFLHVLTHWFAHILHLYWRAPFKVYSSSWLMTPHGFHSLFVLLQQADLKYMASWPMPLSIIVRKNWFLEHLEANAWVALMTDSMGDLTCHQWSKSCIQSSFVKTRGGASRVGEGTQSHFLCPSKPMSDGGCRVTLHLECSWCQVCWCNEIRHRLLFLSSAHDLIFTQTSRLDRQSLGRKDLELSCGVVPSQGRNSQ